MEFLYPTNIMNRDIFISLVIIMNNCVDNEYVGTDILSFTWSNNRIRHIILMFLIFINISQFIKKFP